MSTEATPAERLLSAHAAEEIRALMGRRDINKTELARRLGVSDMWVGRRLRGKLPIDIDDLQRIAVVLGVVAGDLLPKEARSTTHEYSAAIDPLAARVIRTVGETPLTASPTRPVRQTRPLRPPGRRDTPRDTPKTRPHSPIAA
jgi:transcriptional regulator with XRE-family HTH domain